MDPIRRNRFLKRVGLGLYCLSCAAMAATSLAAVALAVGVAGLTSISTPLDGFLSAWGLPLFLVSVAMVLWTMRRSAPVAIGLMGVGGFVTAASMVAMDQRAAPIASDGMAGMQSQASTVGALGISLLFWVGASLLVSGFVWGRARGHRIVRETSAD